MVNEILSRSALRPMRREVALTLSLLMCSNAGPARAESPLDIKADKPAVTVRAHGRPLLRYRYADVPFKPYVERWYSPRGVNVLLDAPADHKHHHGLMFAVSVNGVNFWEEHKAPGRQAHRRFTDLKTDRRQPFDRAVFTEHLDWINPADHTLLVQERRTLKVYHAKDLQASLLTWQSAFSLPRDKSTATVSGSSYFGLGMRFLRSMDSSGRFFNADGATGVDGTNDARSAWCAYTAQADGKLVTVAMFDHPDNLRHPATWFTMNEPFAYLSNTLNLSKEPITLTSTKPLRLRYGAALWDGRVDARTIESLFHQWITLSVAGSSSPAPSPRN